ncbi:MAG TPA: hypothetical protein VLB51_02135 [Methylomirabilota bacterium]|nr:hypothetical protein [Methylomirabilota bacterium]
MTKRPAILALVLLAVAAPSVAQQHLLFSNAPNGSTTSNQSRLVAGGPLATDTEVADDFDVIGNVERVIATGNGCFQCAPPDVVGVWVRFWESTSAGPGALQAEHFVAAGDPAFVYDPVVPDTLDVTLPTPFVATGAHFLSVQLEFSPDSGFWDWWLSHEGQPRGAALQYRDAAAGGSWGPHIDFLGVTTDADTAFELYGTTDPPPPDLVAGCGRWRAVPTPSPPEAHHAVLRDVVVDGTGAWAVGEYAALIQGHVRQFTLVERWDGQRWEIVPSPSPAPVPALTTSGLDAADVVGGVLWAGGSTIRQDVMGYSGSQVLVLRRDGGVWEEIATPATTQCSGNFIHGLKMFAPDDGLFVGEGCSLDGTGSQRGAIVMHWDGTGWSIPPLPDPHPASPGYGLEAVDGVAPDDVWAVGGGPDGDWVGYSYVIHWDGSSWQHVPVELPAGNVGARLFNVDAFAADNVWMGGQVQIGVSIEPLVLHWDGVTLRVVDAPAGGAGFVNLPGRGVLSVGTGGVALWDGATWSLEPTIQGVPGASILALASAGSCEAWGVGRQDVGGDLLALAVRLEAAEPDTVLFADGFESGSAASWSDVLP